MHFIPFFGLFLQTGVVGIVLPTITTPIAVATFMNAGSHSYPPHTKLEFSGVIFVIPAEQVRSAWSNLSRLRDRGCIEFYVAILISMLATTSFISIFIIKLLVLLNIRIHYQNLLSEYEYINGGMKVIR